MQELLLVDLQRGGLAGLFVTSKVHFGGVALPERRQDIVLVVKYRRGFLWA